jgi:aminopeptidase N
MLRSATILFLMCLMIEMKAQPELESMAKSEMAKYKTLRQAPVKRSAGVDLDIHFVELSFEPDMVTGEIKYGSVLYHFKPAASTSALEFDLRNELTVDSITYHGSSLSYTHNANLIRVSLPGLISAGMSDSLRITYHGKPNMSNRSYTLMMTASGPNVATLSQPYDAHFWWPCRENLSDKIDSLNVRLMVDTPYTAVSNGRLFNTTAIGKKRLFEFRHRYPVATYLVAVSFANYNFYTQPAYLTSINQPMDIQNYVFKKNDLADAKKKTFETVKIIRLFDSLFGTYPFHKEHYGHAQFTWGGGMEHQTMSFMVNFNYDLIGHELAHQWFGDKLTCGTWKEIWLNEGFATYCNLLCYDFLRTRPEWLALLKKNKADVMSQPGGSVYAYDTVSVDRLFEYRTTYQKGAMVMHQLRWVIGDAAFFSALRKYLADSRLAYGFTTQKDLKAYFEQESGMDLSDYFDDWINKQGYPQYDVMWAQKGRELSVDLVQTQSHTSVNGFNVPLPVLVKGFNRDTMLRIDIQSNLQNYKINLDFKVRELVFDPDEWVMARYEVKFSKPDSDNVTVYPNPFNGFLYLSLDDMDIKDWEIVDATGKQVYSRQYASALAKGSIEAIDCNFLASGLYILKMSNDTRTLVKKIVKN